MASRVLLRFPAVKERVGLSRAAIYLAIAKGTFPPPIKLGERASGWIDSEIDQWIDARIASSRG